MNGNYHHSDEAISRSGIGIHLTGSSARIRAGAISTCRGDCFAMFGKDK